MATLTVNLINAYRDPLFALYTGEVGRVRTNSLVARVQGNPGSLSNKFEVKELVLHETYSVRMFCAGYKPVGQFVLMSKDEQAIDIMCPVDPNRVMAQFPKYDALEAPLKAVLLSSIACEGFEKVCGQELWEELNHLEKAGLLNIYAKMSRTSMGGKLNAWRFINRLYRLRGDRIFADVQVDFRDKVKTAVAETFKTVSSSLHTPPQGYDHAGSFKTRDPFGNLQLTFFSTREGTALSFKVDADIDDAAGPAHTFQVLDHAITGGATHPFDIHEILAYHQGIDPGYTLHI